MDTVKKVRVCASLDADQHRKLKADCAMKDLDIGEVIEDLVRRYLAGDAPPPSPGSDESDPLCSMVRACVSAGEPWASGIRGLITSVYSRMRRETD